MQVGSGHTNFMLDNPGGTFFSVVNAWIPC